MSLDKYSGPWNSEVALHLLRRTSFVPKKSNLDQALLDGMDATVDKILTPKTNVEPPLNYAFENDPNVPIGETWVDAPFSQTVGLNQYRGASLAGWIIGQMVEDSISIEEKMILFWHNHFVVSNIEDPRFLYLNYEMLRTNALGNFRTFVQKVTTDPSMLRFLNGNQNTVEAPNENYARELLELFTLGKGEAVGNGDYTTYTEDDVQEIAKVLTGWRDVGSNSGTVSISSVFQNFRHDKSTKQLSHRFDNVQISNAGASEYKDLIDIIMEKDEVATFIVRNIYRWFLYYDITEEIEEKIIEPLATIFRDSDYEISTVMDTLLRSEHFYDACHVGALIKSPMDFLLNTISLFELPTTVPQLSLRYQYWISLFSAAGSMQMNVYGHPSVAGWKAYYQSPAYYRVWLNSVTLPLRKSLIDVLWITGFNLGDMNVKIDPFAVLEWVSEPTDINVIIEDVSRMLVPRPLNDGQRAYLKGLVLQGLPDFEWTVEYVDYLADPDDPIKKGAINLKLTVLFYSMCQLPEFQLS